MQEDQLAVSPSARNSTFVSPLEKIAGQLYKELHSAVQSLSRQARVSYPIAEDAFTFAVGDLFRTFLGREHELPSSPGAYVRRAAFYRLLRDKRRSAEPEERLAGIEVHEDPSRGAEGSEAKALMKTGFRQLTRLQRKALKAVLRGRELSEVAKELYGPEGKANTVAALVYRAKEHLKSCCACLDPQLAPRG